MLHVDVLMVTVVFINVICKAYPRANEKHWDDDNYDDHTRRPPPPPQKNEKQNKIK